MISFEHKGNFKRTDQFLKNLAKDRMFASLDRLGREGVSALISVTPVDSGLTAASWGYVIEHRNGSYSLNWVNSNDFGGPPIAVMLQYGHGTGTGGYVQGRDYINPAIRPIFDKIADQLWKEVSSS